MYRRSIDRLLVTGSALLCLSAAASAQSSESARPEAPDLTHFFYDLGTGEITFGSSGPKTGSGYVERFVNNDQSGRAGYRGAVFQQEELLDWGVLSLDTGTDIIARLTFGYSTTALDDSIGGAGANVTLRLYEGATGGCADAGRTPAAELVLTGLPGSTDGLPKGFVTTVVLDGADAFCLDPGPFGFGFTSSDTTTGGFFDATVPLLCYAGDPFGNPTMDLDTNGQVSRYNVYDATVETGICTFDGDFGGGIDDASFLLYLETPDVASAPAASASFRNGLGTNPAGYAVALPPTLDGFFSASVQSAAGGLGTFLFGYQGDDSGTPTPFGEVLLDLGSPNVLAGLEGPYLFDSSGVAAFRLAVPCDLDLCGLKFATQALEFGAGLQLHNAQDLVVGF